MVKERKTGRAQVGLRVSEDMRRRLENAARSNDCSINAEILERLERSFETEDRLGGPRVVSILETVATAMRTTGEHGAFLATSKRHNEGAWLDHPFAFDQAVKACLAILEAFRPDGAIVVPSLLPDVIATTDQDVDVERLIETMELVGKYLGEGVARGVLDREEKK